MVDMKLLNYSSLLRSKSVIIVFILSFIYLLAFSVRLFSIIRFELMIHEFDPYFNYRTTTFLINSGFDKFTNWFDNNTWYPLGRIIGGTLYPGLMLTSYILYYVLYYLSISISVKDVCVLLAPFMAANTTIVTYLFCKEVSNSYRAGLISAAFISVVPGYISRSVAGSYDNECVSIFSLILTFYFWVLSVKTGRVLHSIFASLAYWYMVANWGGYIFIINIIPLHVLVSVFSGLYTKRMYIAYSTFYLLGTLLAMQITFVGFQAVRSSEHMLALGTFIFLQIYELITYLKTFNIPNASEIIRKVIYSLLSVFVFIFLVLWMIGYISPWTGRFYSLLDPTYAKEHIPIIASVSEHQPTAWSSFFFDLHILTFLIPAGLYFCFKNLNDVNLFLILYGLFSVYFAGVMVRLVLVLSPAACVLGGIATSKTLSNYFDVALNTTPSAPITSKRKEKDVTVFSTVPNWVGWVVVAGAAIVLSSFIYHSTWVTSEAYSSPSIVLSAKQRDGTRIIFDDFREGYSWLSHNTDENAKIMSWWDYGYQITAIANRTVLVDNNTWNNTHIATVGRMMASPESVAYPVMKKLDVDYVLVIFGGLTGYASDDINKFLWMVRIGGGVFKDIEESDYFTEKGEYKIDSEASPAMLNSLMYKMCYYRFGQIMTEASKPTGYDRVRNAEIGRKNIDFEHLEEVFTSEHWIVRIYKVVDEPNFS